MESDLEESFPKMGLTKGSVDISDKVFGELTALYRTINHVQPSGTTKSRWVCKCSCGKIKVVQYYNLKSGATTSCGRCKSENSKVFKITDIKGVRYGYDNEDIDTYGNTRHGQSKKRIFYIWLGMLTRCFNEDNKAFPYYGGRGITVCERWLNLKNFIEDNEGSCGEDLSLDRVDGEGNYCPENTRWIPLPQQSQNTAPKHWGKVKYKGVCWSLTKNKYRANCYLEGKQTHLGFFDNAVDAALEYDSFVTANKDIYWLNRDHFPEVMDKYLQERKYR